METKQFLQSPDGKYSAMRLALFIYLVPLILTWAFISYSKKELQPLDNSLVTGLGLLIGGKSVQSFQEKSTKTENSLTKP